MKLSNLVNDNRHTSKFKPSARSDQHIAVHSTQRPKSQRKDMASALTASPYSNPPPVYSRSPQPPPSPPIEDPNSKCTLPSIQSLIGMADVPASNHEQQSKLCSRRLRGTYELTFWAAEVERPGSRQQLQGDNPQSMDFRSQTYGQPSVSNPGALPPSPPLRPEYGFDGSNQSPSAASSHSSTAGVPYFGSAINNVEPHHQRQSLSMPSHAGNSMPSQASSSYQVSTYPPSPGGISNYSYPSPAHPTAAASAMYYQRSLPATFTPPSIPASLTPVLSNSQDGSSVDQNNLWQHHHYISPSSTAAFASQSQDRYVCQTCNKAFSRPSSLRIHSHSHTGEKPFKCPHSGCGKAFSVRSNMKRHERGCHGGGSPGSS